MEEGKEGSICGNTNDWYVAAQGRGSRKDWYVQHKGGGIKERSVRDSITEGGQGRASRWQHKEGTSRKDVQVAAQAKGPRKDQ